MNALIALKLFQISKELVMKPPLRVTPTKTHTHTHRIAACFLAWIQKKELVIRQMNAIMCR